MFIESNCPYIHTFSMSERRVLFEDQPFKMFSILRHDLPLSKAQSADTYYLLVTKRHHYLEFINVGIFNTRSNLLVHRKLKPFWLKSFSIFAGIRGSVVRWL